jgi:hypothetical protein
MGSTDMVGSLSLIREFDGKSSGIGVTEFLNQVNEVGVLNDWDEKKKILVARLKMTGSARLFRDHEEAFIALTDWVDFCKAMRARFVPVTSDDAKLFKYLNASQKENETIFDFATRLSVLHDKAKPAVPGESEATKAARLASKYADLKPLFLRGLFDKNLARRVMDRSPSSYNNAVIMASTLDANKKTFDSDTTLALNAVGQSPPVKKGPKIDFKKLQNQDGEEKRSDSRPTTPTNFNSGATATYGPASGPDFRNGARATSHNQTYQSTRDGFRGGSHAPRSSSQDRSFSRAPRDASRERYFNNQPFEYTPHGYFVSQRGEQPRRIFYQNTGRGQYSPARGSPHAYNTQRSRAPGPNSSRCFLCGDTSHWANKCTTRRSNGYQRGALN